MLNKIHRIVQLTKVKHPTRLGFSTREQLSSTFLLLLVKLFGLKRCAVANESFQYYFALLCSLLWNSQTEGSFNNPYKSAEERRRNIGKLGRRIGLVTNHFNMKLSTRIRSIHRYDVDMTFPDWKRPPRKKDMDILIRAFEGNIKIICMSYRISETFSNICYHSPHFP